MQKPSPIEALSAKQIGCGCLAAGAVFFAVTVVPCVVVLFHFVAKHW